MQSKELITDLNLLYKRIRWASPIVLSLISLWTVQKNHKLKLQKDNILSKILMKTGSFQGKI